MEVYNKQEVQKHVLDYTVTLISDEKILIDSIIGEDIREDRDGNTIIELRLSTYMHGLYKAFKHKELTKMIVKRSENTRIDNMEVVERMFRYGDYFKITEFNTYTDTGSCPVYTVIFETV